MTNGQQANNHKDMIDDKASPIPQSLAPTNHHNF